MTSWMKSIKGTISCAGEDIEKRVIVDFLAHMFFGDCGRKNISNSQYDEHELMVVIDGCDSSGGCLQW